MTRTTSTTEQKRWGVNPLSVLRRPLPLGWLTVFFLCAGWVLGSTAALGVGAGIMAAVLVGALD